MTRIVGGTVPRGDLSHQKNSQSPLRPEVQRGMWVRGLAIPFEHEVRRSGAQRSVDVRGQPGN